MAANRKAGAAIPAGGESGLAGGVGRDLRYDYCGWVILATVAATHHRQTAGDFSLPNFCCGELPQRLAPAGGAAFYGVCGRVAGD